MVEEINIAEEKSIWKKDIASLEKSNIKRSIGQLINTIVPFIVLWGLSYLSQSISIWITLALAIPAAGFMIRTFIIFHDCCHQSFFKSRRANAIIGTITGIMTFFPYYRWKNEHSVHHATSGNLNRRGTGDIWTLTVDEYLALPLLRRLYYRIYRNPLVMFGLGPIYIFLIEYRFNRKGARRKERLNAYITNLGIVGMTGLLCWTLGWQGVLLVQLPILYVAGMAGIWLFYVQHQFEDTYFEKADNWNYVTAAIEGSSFYKLPKILQWVTGNIGFHHVHHLSPQVPNYNLQRGHESISVLRNVPAIGLIFSLRALQYRLWDENRKQFVGFNNITIR